ncbi:MAG: sigma-E processing peptidase SpoIIGA [Eubacteriaceae bacterium]
MYYVYGEVVIIENILINLIILIFTSKIIRKKNNIYRFIIASLFGAIYSIMQLQYDILNYIIIKIVLSILIITICFYPFSIRELINALLVFYGISFFFGGCVIALIFFMKANTDLTFQIKGVTSSIIIIGILISILIVIKIKSLIVDIKLKNCNTDIIDIVICIGNNKLRIKGFIDTGCSLLDNLTGKPILLTEYNEIKKILPIEIQKYYDNYTDKIDYDIDKKITDLNILKKIRFIPYNTINSENEYLLCFLVDYIELINNDFVQKIDKVCIGICKKNLSDNKQFQALINPKLLYV